MSNIIVEVSGGMVQEVYSDDKSVTVTLIDWDNIEDRDTIDFIELNNYGIALRNMVMMQVLINKANNRIQDNINWNNKNK